MKELHSSAERSADALAAEWPMVQHQRRELEFAADNELPTVRVTLSPETVCHAAGLAYSQEPVAAQFARWSQKHHVIMSKDLPKIGKVVYYM
jgi:hypothetical protein